MTATAPRFLIVRLGSLGDVIHAIPAAAALRAHVPAARIDWLVDPQYVELVSLVRGVDRAVSIDPRGRVRTLLATLRALRASRYEAVFDLQGLLKSAVLARLAGGGRTIGFPRAHLREPAAALLYTETPDPGGNPHVVFKNVALLAAVGVSTTAIEFPLEIPSTPAVAAIHSLVGHREYALINPGAAWPNKRWPPERFGAVAAALGRTGLRSVVLWGPGEESRARAVVDAAGGAAVLAPATGMRDLFAVAQQARLMISGDTGPLHIAAAVGTPLVALFGPTRPERNGPWSAADIVVSRVDRCACLYERQCRKAAPCIDDISAAEVVDAAERRMHARA